MPAAPEDPAPRAGKLPSGPLARTARVGGLVAGQGLRWAGMRTANRMRNPEDAAAARNDRTAALVGQLVDQLAQMRGAAMKVGQMLSMVEFDGLPPDQQDDLRRRLAALRDDVPPVPFARLEKLLRHELGAPLARVFSEFETEAFAAASIGQVHRATTVSGEDVVVKVQYPGVAEAVETDLRNANLLLPLVRRLAPGLDGGALLGELRERIGEELDYELEAANQRRIERLTRGHPFIFVPRVYPGLSSRRVLVSDYVEGERFEAVRTSAEDVRDTFGEIVFRFFFGLLYRDGIALGDPHPGNYLRRPDGTVAFLDYGLLRDVGPERLAGERALARAVRERDPDAVTAALIAAGYLPAARADAVEPSFALGLMRMALKWYAVPGARRWNGSGRPGDRGPRPHRDRSGDGPAGDGRGARDSGAERPRGPSGDRARPDRPPLPDRDAARRQVHQFTMPADALLVRRMHGMVAVVLAQLRAGGDWGAIAAEYLHGAPPASPLGEAEAAFLARRRA